MEKSMGILLMVTFGISGVVVTALAWLCPALYLDKLMATMAGFIGVSFTVFQGLRLMYSGHTVAEPVSIETATEE